jgi:hypothetical protein
MGRPASRREEAVYKEAEDEEDEDEEEEDEEEDGVGGVEPGVEVSPSLCVQCMHASIREERERLARLCIWGDGANHLG